MNNQPEVDKFRVNEGRDAAKYEKDSEFLNDEGLDDDLVDLELDSHDDDDAQIVDSESPENQEVNIREQ